MKKYAILFLGLLLGSQSFCVPDSAQKNSPKTSAMSMLKDLKGKVEPIIASHDGVFVKQKVIEIVQNSKIASQDLDLETRKEFIDLLIVEVQKAKQHQMGLLVPNVWGTSIVGGLIVGGAVMMLTMKDANANARWYWLTAIPMAAAASWSVYDGNIIADNCDGLLKALNELKISLGLELRQYQLQQKQQAG